MGEFELLARVRERLPQDGARLHLGMGDDAAVTVPGGATATSVDALVEGVHFRRELASLAQIGHKALAAALSDLAAMGAEPGEAYVALGVPRDLDEDGCIELLDGLARLADETGTVLAGGDISQAPALSVTLTVVGHAAKPGQLVSRAGAVPGDVLVVTGELGAAAAGLLALKEPEVSATLPSSTAASLRTRQLEPQPRLAAGLALAGAGARAMIDLSDGLGGDLSHLASASGAGAEVEAAELPLAAGVAEVAEAAGRNPFELAVSGGEDYELLAAVPPDRLEEAQAAVEHSGSPLTRVGRVVAGEEVAIRLPGGETMTAAGFDQLS